MIARRHYPFLLAAGVGLAYSLIARFFFDNSPLHSSSFANDLLPTSGLLSLAFLLVMPLALGAITAHFTPEAADSWWRLMWAPSLVVLTFLFTALLFHLEGFICVIIIFPAFLIMAAIGAHAYAGIADILRNKHDRTLVVAAFALLPFLPCFLSWLAPSKATSTTPTIFGVWRTRLSLMRRRQWSGSTSSASPPSGPQI